MFSLKHCNPVLKWEKNPGLVSLTGSAPNVTSVYSGLRPSFVEIHSVVFVLSRWQSNQQAHVQTKMGENSTFVAVGRVIFVVLLIYLVLFRQWRRSTKPVWSIQSGSRDTTLASSPGSTPNRLHYPASRSLSSASSVLRAWRKLMRAPWLRPRIEKQTATNTHT